MASAVCIQEIVYGDEHYATLKNAVRQSRTAADVLDTSPIREKIADMDEQLKASKDAGKDKPESTSSGPTPVNSQFAVASGFSPIDSEFSKAQVQLIMSLDEEARDLVSHFEEKANRGVREGAKLVFETTHNAMVDQLKESTVAQLAIPDDAYLLVNFDVGYLGESVSSPWARRVSLSAPILKKAMAAIVEVRCDGDGIQDNDLFAFHDGGKHACEAAMLGTLVDPTNGKQIPKVKKDSLRQLHGRLG